MSEIRLARIEETLIKIAREVGETNGTVKALSQTITEQATRYTALEGRVQSGEISRAEYGTKAGLLHHGINTLWTAIVAGLVGYTTHRYS